MNESRNNEPRRPDCVTEVRMGNTVLVVSGYFKKDAAATAPTPSTAAAANAFVFRFFLFLSFFMMSSFLVFGIVCSGVQP